MFYPNFTLLSFQNLQGCGIINAESLAEQVFGLRPMHALRACVIDGLAKMSVRAHIFASWYNKRRKPCGASLWASPSHCYAVLWH